MEDRVSKQCEAGDRYLAHLRAGCAGGEWFAKAGRSARLQASGMERAWMVSVSRRLRSPDALLSLSVSFSGALGGRPPHHLVTGWAGEGTAVGGIDTHSHRKL